MNCERPHERERVRILEQLVNEGASLYCKKYKKDIRMLEVYNYGCCWDNSYKDSESFKDFYCKFLETKWRQRT